MIHGIEYPATWIFHSRWIITKAQIADFHGN